MFRKILSKKVQAKTQKARPIHLKLPTIQQFAFEKLVQADSDLKLGLSPISSNGSTHGNINWLNTPFFDASGHKIILKVTYKGRIELEMKGAAPKIKEQEFIAFCFKLLEVQKQIFFSIGKLTEEQQFLINELLLNYANNESIYMTWKEPTIFTIISKDSKNDVLKLHVSPIGKFLLEKTESSDDEIRNKWNKLIAQLQDIENRLDPSTPTTPPPSPTSISSSDSERSRRESKNSSPLSPDSLQSSRGSSDSASKISDSSSQNSRGSSDSETEAAKNEHWHFSGGRTRIRVLWHDIDSPSSSESDSDISHSRSSFDSESDSQSRPVRWWKSSYPR